MHVFLLKELTAPLLLKSKETSELSSETCAALQVCLELLSNQEEVSKHHHVLIIFHHHILHTQFNFFTTIKILKVI